MQEVQKAVGKCGRDGKARKGNSTLHTTNKIPSVQLELEIMLGWCFCQVQVQPVNDCEHD